MIARKLGGKQSSRCGMQGKSVESQGPDVEGGDSAAEKLRRKAQPSVEAGGEEQYDLIPDILRLQVPPPPTILPTELPVFRMSWYDRPGHD